MKRIALFAILGLLFGACSDGATPPSGDLFPAALSGAPYEPDIDPARFHNEIDNPYFPLEPGTTFVFEGSSDGEKETGTVTVTDETKKILGIDCVAVRDEVKVDGELAELTFDWFAQDDDGNVWYMGEDSSDYEDGKKVSSEGSWEAGVDGAQPGIVMPGSPRVGLEYRQEYYEGEAEDIAKVIATDGEVKTDYDSFTDLVVTEDRNPLEPEILERKYYAKGLGVVLERHIKGSDEQMELVRVDR